MEPAVVVDVDPVEVEEAVAARAVHELPPEIVVDDLHIHRPLRVVRVAAEEVVWLLFDPESDVDVRDVVLAGPAGAARRIEPLDLNAHRAEATLPRVDVPQAESVRVDLDPAAVMVAFAAHRRRFATEVGSLDAAGLAAPSRCEKWSNADVLRHLVDVDGWMRALWAHQPPPFTSFDPNTTPHEFVVAARSTPDEAVRDAYVASSEEMAGHVSKCGPECWGDASISPLGAVPWWLSALHIFWDSWLHERDVFLPLGIDVPEEPNEIEPVFAYALALAGRMSSGDIDAEIAGVHVETSDVAAGGILPGRAVTVTPVAPDHDVCALIDALAGRGEAGVPDGLNGLARLFLT